MNDTELKVINLFKQNPTLSITQVAEKLDISRAIASKYLNRNASVLLENGSTIKEQLEYNKVYGTSNGAVVKNKKDTERREEKEELVVKYFKENPKMTLDEIAEKFEIAKSTVSKYLSSHKDEILSNGNTVKDQLEINQNLGRMKGADLIGRNSVSIKNDTGRFTGSISTISGTDFQLTSKSGARIGSLTITDKMEEQITREAIYYLVHNKSLEEKKKENQKIGRINHSYKGGRASMYDQDMINHLCDCILQNSYTYQEAEEMLVIPSSTLFELMKRVDEKRRAELDLLAIANQKNTSINEYLEEHGKRRK